MKRDMELIRSILLQVESNDFRPDEIPKYKDFPDEIIAYHVELLIRSGYLTGLTHPIGNNIRQFDHIESLTWEGHDLLDTIREDSIWASIKDQIKKSGSDIRSVPLKIIAKFALDIVEQKLSP